MTDEDKKRIVSEPPPPTDEIDDEWGDDDQTLIRDVPESVTKSQPAPPSGNVVGKTAVAPISVPPHSAPAAAAAEEDADDEEADDEDDEDDEDETANEDDEQDEDEDEAHAEPLHTAPTGPGSEWIPEWAPFAVLGLLVTASIVFGLGLVGGPDTEHEGGEDAAPAASVVAPTKPSPHP
jgi:hypothetical protein